MAVETQGIVLRSVKYGESSLVSTIFTRVYGVQSYLMQGVRKAKGNRAALLQPGAILEIVTDRKPGANLQRLKEYRFSYVYQALQEDIVKNTVALFSLEILLRLLPESADMPELFDFCYTYLCTLDKMPVKEIPNYPIFFAIYCGKSLGYQINGNYSDNTPYLNLLEGRFSNHPDGIHISPDVVQSRLIDAINNIDKLEDTSQLSMNANTRFEILEWYITFLKTHTQHMGNFKSLQVLKAILH